MTRTELHALLGTRWALPVLTTLAGSRMRFNGIKRACAPISAKTLSASLAYLLRAGLVGAPEFDGYEITDRGVQVLAWSNLLPLVGA